jgi:hypothetical protein
MKEFLFLYDVHFFGKNVRQFPQDYFLYNIAVLQEKLSDVTIGLCT